MSENPLYKIITKVERESNCTETETITSNQGYTFIVPANVAEKVKQYTWSVGKRKIDGYHSIETGKHFNGRRWNIKLSHFLMGTVPKNYDVIDHINRNPLDNSWQNLRFATYKSNASNIAPKGASKYYGVQKNKNRWVVNVQKDYYGVYDNELHAAWVYNLVVKKHGYIMPLNDIETAPDDFTGVDLNAFETREKKVRKRSKNEVVVQDIVRDRDGHALIKVGTQHWAKVDDAHFYVLNQVKWRKGVSYARTTVDSVPISMHRYIYDVILNESIPKGMVIDHINRDPLDNRTENFRVVSLSTNAQNCSREINKSGFIGVFQRNEVFQAGILDKGTYKYLGTYYNIETAAYAYDCAALQLHGKGARINGVEKPITHEWDAESMTLNQIAIVKLSKYGNNKNGFKGIDLVGGKYRANVKLQNGESIWLGTFDSAEVAAYAHNCMCIQLLKEKAVINDVPEPEGFYWDADEKKLKQVKKVNQNRAIKGSIGYKGLTISNNKFSAAVYVEGKRFHLGVYETKELAAFAYNCGAQQLLGKDARLNDIEEPDSYKWNKSTLRLEKN